MHAEHNRIAHHRLTHSATSSSWHLADSDYYTSAQQHHTLSNVYTFCGHRFSPDTSFGDDEVAEWLRQWTVNLLCFACRGLNIILVELLCYIVIQMW